MAIAAPYVTPEQVAFFQRNLLLGATDFSPNTPVTEQAMNQFIAWSSATVDTYFSQAGYIIPFQDLEGEVWPTHQTLYLQFLTSLGASSMISPSLKPAPATGAGRTGSAGNVFQDLYSTELKRIYDGRFTQLRFRAKYYLGTPAEKALLEPSSPTSDFMLGRVDPTKFMSLPEYTEFFTNVAKSVRGKSIDWDYMYSLFGMGYGPI